MSGNIDKNDYENEIMPNNQKMARTCSHEHIESCLSTQRDGLRLSRVCNSSMPFCIPRSILTKDKKDRPCSAR